jgi:hypothetical protein
MKHSLLLFVCLAMGAGVINSGVEFDNINGDPVIERLCQKKREEAVKIVSEAIDSCYKVKNENVLKLFGNSSPDNLTWILTNKQLQQGASEALENAELTGCCLCEKMAHAMLDRVKMRQRLK